MPALILPPPDPEPAVHDIAGAAVDRRLVVAPRSGPSSPGVEAFLTAIADQVDRLDAGSIRAG